MTEFLSILLVTALANNVVLVQLTGVSSLFAFSFRFQQALEMAVFSFIILFSASFLGSLVHRFILSPLSLEFLQLICYLAISGSLTTVLGQQVRKLLPVTARHQNLTFMLAGGNSAVIGSALILADSHYSLLQSLAYSLGAGFGFAVLLLAFAALRQRLDHESVPLIFRGPAIQLISAGLISLSLIALAGGA